MYQEVICTVFHLTQNLKILIKKVYMNSHHHHLFSYSSILQRYHLSTHIKEPDLICTILHIQRAVCSLCVGAVRKDYYIDDN